LKCILLHFNEILIIKVSFLRWLCSGICKNAIKAATLRKDLNAMRKAELIVDAISPTMQYCGKKELAIAIKKMASLASSSGFDTIQVTKDVYPAMKKARSASLNTAERALYRAVDLCWMNGNNEMLNRIIGKQLPCKPQPSLLIMYCAYFYIYDQAYHDAAPKMISLLLGHGGKHLFTEQPGAVSAESVR